MADLETIRDQIANTQAEIAELQDRSVTRDEAAERLEAWVDSQAARINGRSLAMSAIRGERKIDAEPLSAFVHPGPDGYGQTVDMSAFMAWLSPDAFKSRLLAELDAHADQCADKPQKQRKAALTKAQNKLDELERDEERLIVESEIGGQVLPRRADVRPEIVLAVDETEPETNDAE